jgi:phage tail sheath protein FI
MMQQQQRYAMYYSVKKAIDILADPEFVEMNLVTVPGITNESITQHLINVCEDRGDALAIIDPKGGYIPASEDGTKTEQQRISTNHVNEVVRNMQRRALNSSYGCTYYPWVRINDDIGGGSLYVPPSVAAIGTMAFSDKQKAVWFAPAGFNRGGLSRGQLDSRSQMFALSLLLLKEMTFMKQTLIQLHLSQVREL